MPISKIDQLIERQKKLKAKIEREKAKENKKIEKKRFRKIVLIGTYFLKKYESNGNLDELLNEMDSFLNRDSDRKLFGLKNIQNEKID